jgi:hypothetical protein
MNVMGCDHYGYNFGKAIGDKALYNRDNCNNPSPAGWIAAFYMVSIIVLGSQVRRGW